jgi:hypothetical protein
MKSFLRAVTGGFLVLGSAACTFNFDVMTQRTALENQVMGSYRELEDDLILVSSVRSAKQARRGKGKDGAVAAMSESKRRALDARQNQDFNRDDLEELKDKTVIGETASGAVAFLPAGIGGEARGSASERKLAQTLIAEENRDRETIWQRYIAANPNLKEKDLPVVKRTYAKIQRDQMRKGQWYQDEGGRWEAKQ